MCRMALCNVPYCDTWSISVYLFTSIYFEHLSGHCFDFVALTKQADKVSDQLTGLDVSTRSCWSVKLTLKERRCRTISRTVKQTIKAGY